VQIVLATEAYVAEGQFLPEEQTLNKAKSLIYRARIENQPFPKENIIYNKDKIENGTVY
jgi:hypothetical protein